MLRKICLAHFYFVLHVIRIDLKKNTVSLPSAARKGTPDGRLEMIEQICASVQPRGMTNVISIEVKTNLLILWEATTLACAWI